MQIYVGLYFCINLKFFILGHILQEELFFFLLQ